MTFDELKFTLEKWGKCEFDVGRNGVKRDIRPTVSTVLRQNVRPVNISLSSLLLSSGQVGTIFGQLRLS